MMEQPNINIKKILDEAKNIYDETEQTPDKSIYENIRKRIFQPLALVDYKNDKEKITNNDYELVFSKTEIEQTDKKEMGNYACFLNTHEMADDLIGLFDDNSNWFNIDNWYAVNKLDYSIGNTKINIFDLLPSGYKIIFCPNSKIKHGRILQNYKVIFLAGDPFSPGGLATILHEIGHLKNNEQFEQLYSTKLIENKLPSEDVKAGKLKIERDASLFALRKMWPILREYPQLKSDIILYLKNMSYYSYCKSILFPPQKSSYSCCPYNRQETQLSENSTAPQESLSRGLLRGNGIK